MILTGNEILKRRREGDISIDPFHADKVNPNSYNLSLHNKLKVYDRSVMILDIKKDNPTTEIIIPDEGMILRPLNLYLGSTVEFTKTYNLVPMVEGRSSLGRLGIFIHVTAGFGDVGFCGKWTLEMTVVEPVKIYPWIECCQIYYHTVEGAVTNYQGRYQNAKEVQGSKLYQTLHQEMVRDKTDLFGTKFNGAVCRGSYALGTACDRCSSCMQERKTRPDLYEKFKERKRKNS